MFENADERFKSKYMKTFRKIMFENSNESVKWKYVNTF